MLEEERVDANTEDTSSVSQDENADSSSADEQVQDTETATPQQAESPEEVEQPEAEEAPFHEHPRFKELVEERKYWRELAMKGLQSPPTPQAPAQPQKPVDPYAHLSPEEQVFYRNMDKRIEEKAAEIVEKRTSATNEQIKAAQQEFARMKVQQFRQQHPDVKPNSPEEAEIAERIRMGYQPDDAYWSVMGPRGVQAAQQQVKKQVKQTIKAKKHANVEAAPGIQPRSGLPQQGKGDFRSTVERYMGQFGE